ncbi:MAG: hydrolase, partial [Deltaproteobacteria bacterium]|nr:hydrolase [Deltaproteobacteria bacterium]
MPTVAVAQVCAGADRGANLDQAASLVREAADLGAHTVCLPEMWPFVGPDEDKVAGAETLSGPSMSAMRELARTLGLWLFPGSFAEKSEVEDRVFNCSPVINPEGAVVAVYRKIHLFDIHMDDGPTLLETDTVVPGDQAVVADACGLTWGLTVCYDLRFPSLYKALRDAGAHVLLVPAAFTAHTGKAHWEVLLRARAIEQQCYVVAADQWGRHNPRRESHGQSMIVDPWGAVIARVSD